MSWLRHLRWKLFVSHLLIILIGVVVLLPTAHFLARTQLPQEPSLALGSAGAVATVVQAVVRRVEAEPYFQPGKAMSFPLSSVREVADERTGELLYRAV